MLLPAPFGPHEGDLLAGADAQVDAPQRLEAVGVAEVDVLELDRAAGRRRRRRRAAGARGSCACGCACGPARLVGVDVLVRVARAGSRGHWRGSHRNATTS